MLKIIKTIEREQEAVLRTKTGVGLTYHEYMTLREIALAAEAWTNSKLTKETEGFNCSKTAFDTHEENSRVLYLAVRKADER